MSSARTDRMETILPRCACGKPARSLCAVSPELELTLILCRAPICSHNGNWMDCPTHRHNPGTMGYYHPTSEIRYEVKRFVAEDGKLWSRIQALWRNLTWSEQRCAEWTFEHFKAGIKPPAPLSQNFIAIFDTGHRYRSCGLLMLREP